MSTPAARHIPWLVGLGLFGLAAVLGALPGKRVVLRATAPHTPTDVERFGGPRVLGQSFIAPADRLAEITVTLASPAPSTAFPLLAQIRHGRYGDRDIRTVTIGPSDQDRDGRLHIRFQPISKSGGRPYLLVLAAPYAPSRSLTIYRQADGSLYREGNLLYLDRDEDRAGDVEFTLISRAPRLRLLAEQFFPPAAERHSAAAPLLERFVGVLAALAILVMVVARLPAGASRTLSPLVRRLGDVAVWCGQTASRLAPPRRLLAVLVFLNIVLHLPLILAYPVVNDEGAYLMDLANLRDGQWPFRDFLTKGPVFLAVLAPVVWILPHSHLAARLLPLASSAITVLLLFQLGKRLRSTATGLLAAALWALTPAAIAQTSQLFLQNVSLPFSLLGLVILLGPHAGTPPQRTRSAFTAGLCFAAAYLARASSLAFLVAALLLPWTARSRPRHSLGACAVLLGTFLGVLTLTSALALPFLGPTKTAILLNLEAYTIGAARAQLGIAAELLLPKPEGLLADAARLSGSVARAGPFLFMFWGAALADAVRRLLRLPAAVSMVALLGIGLPFLLSLRDQGFSLGHLAGAHAAFLAGATFLMLAGAATLLLLQPAREQGWRAAAREVVVFGVLWLALALLYGRFGRFRQQYHLEFLPLYILGSAVMLERFLTAGLADPRPWARRTLAAVAAGVMALVATTAVRSYDIARLLHHAGSMTPAAVRTVASVIRQHSRPGEEIFTGQPLFTYVADRRIAFAASHPGWYLEERVGTVPTALRRVYFPDRDVVRQHVAERIRVAVTDRRTTEVYLRPDPAFQELLRRDFRVVAEIKEPNDQEPVRVWVRNATMPSTVIRRQ